MSKSEGEHLDAAANPDVQAECPATQQAGTRAEPSLMPRAFEILLPPGLTGEDECAIRVERKWKRACSASTPQASLAWTEASQAGKYTFGASSTAPNVRVPRRRYCGLTSPRGEKLALFFPDPSL